MSNDHHLAAMLKRRGILQCGGVACVLFLLATGVTGTAGAVENAAADGQQRMLISSGSKWEQLAAYSRAVVAGDWVFVSGTVGFNPEDSAIPAGFDQQMDQIFANIKHALRQADAGLEDIVRVRCFIVDAKYVAAMSSKLHQYLSQIRPANTTVVTQLAAEGALIEIEVTALKRK